MSIFQRARQGTEEEYVEEAAPVFKELKQQKQHVQEQIIPPVGIAKPELVESFLQNMDDEDKIRKDIADVEAYERETPFETGKREVLSHGARLYEGFLGGINTFLNMVTPDLELEDEEGIVERHKPIPLPGAKELHERAKEKTGKYLEPKSDLARATQETVKDIGGAFSTPFIGAWNAILGPIGGQLTKQFIKASGGGETAQDIGKLGFMTVSSIANIGNAQRVAGEALRQAENMIPQGVRFTAQPVERALNNIRNSNWFRSGRTPSKGPAMDEIDRIESRIIQGRAGRNNTIDAHEAMQLRRDINEARRQLGGFQLNRPVDRRQALRYLDEVDDALMQGMENYGRNVNPGWLRQYQLGNEAFRVTQRSRLISDLIAQHAKPLQSQTAKTLFHLGAATGALHLPTVGAIAGTAAATAKGVQIINRMIRSPILRNHYVDVLTQATAGNSQAMQKALEKFDIAAAKFEKQEEEFSNKNRPTDQPQ